MKEKIALLFQTFKKQPQFWSVVLLAVVFVFAAAYFGWQWYAAGKIGVGKTEVESPETVPSLLTSRRLVDGAPAEEGKEAPTYPIAVMIENHPEARPQAGLAKANLVYEAITEGGITRFLAIFADGNAIEKIGPVRSARPYYLDWTLEYGALYMHVGGSNDALEKIKMYDVEDLNQYYYGNFYWRDGGTAAPHNVFTSSDFIAKAVELKGLGLEAWTMDSWKYKEDAPLAERPENAPDIAIDYGDLTFDVTWKYDRETNGYARFMGVGPHKDAAGDHIVAKNVVVQFMKMKVLDSVGRKAFTTVGTGDGIIFRDGKAVKMIWKKEDRNSRTRFFDEYGNEIALNGGTTWVEIVPTGFTVEYE